MAKQTTVTIEVDSLVIMRATGAQRGWCSRCAAEAEMVALESLAVVSNLDRQAVETWLNSGELHRMDAADGNAVICLNSLVARLQNVKPADR